MRVGEIAAATGASVRSIRYYERAGLIRAERRDNGYREFDASVVGRVRAIRHLLDTGFTLDDITALAGCLDAAAPDPRCSAQAVAIYRDKLARIDVQMRTLAELRERIEAQIDALQPDGPTSIIAPAAAHS
jgi:DNA-binding transcriptional MerR regulator